MLLEFTVIELDTNMVKHCQKRKSVNPTSDFIVPPKNSHSLTVTIVVSFNLISITTMIQRKNSYVVKLGTRDASISPPVKAFQNRR